mmetsp:Transcript_6290/g.9146  ORF Transcript_6290/g.9146 Transcript_6290/m.9146 type:complete len:309 (-) Transcript_6290:117-1043(-)
MIEYDIRRAMNNLSEKEKKKLQELKDRINKYKWESQHHLKICKENLKKCEKKAKDKFSKEKKYYLNKLQLYRYLYGEDFNVDRAEAEVKKTIEWRLSIEPEQISIKECEDAAKHGFLYHYGVDTHGQPVCYIIMKKLSEALGEAQNNGKMAEFKEALYKLLMRTCEQLQQNMIEKEEEETQQTEKKKKKKFGSHVHRITWIIDMGYCSISMAQARALKDVFYAMGEYYPERMARCIIINASFWINMIISFAKSLCSTTTKAKFKQIKGSNQQIKEKLKKIIDPSEIPESLGYGTANYEYSYEEEIKKE